MSDEQTDSPAGPTAAAPAPVHAPPIERAIAHLLGSDFAWHEMEPRTLADLASESRATTASVAQEWTETAGAIKQITLGTHPISEESQSGPWITMRALRLFERSLRDLAAGHLPRLPGPPVRNHIGRTAVRTFPTDKWDAALFPGVTADTWMRSGVEPADVPRLQAEAYQHPPARPGLTLVLGAGNITSISCTDALYELFVRRHPTVLKMHPMLAPLTPIVRRALQPLVEAGGLEVVDADRAASASLTADPRFARIHMTGSDQTFNRIRFGTPRPGPDATPVTSVPMTAELGNVTPAIVVPGDWSLADVKFQARNIAASVSHNGGCNCVATRVVILPMGWDLSDTFLAEFRSALATTPGRPVYYPGVPERLDQLTAATGGTLSMLGEESHPWAYIDGLEPFGADPWLQEEFFGPATSVVLLPATPVVDYIETAVDLCNDRVWGTLAASIFAHPSSLADVEVGGAIDRAIAQLRYGTIGVNAWSGLGFGIQSTPWGAFPGHDDRNPQSGFGFVHDTFMLGRVEKSVIRAPWRPFPKPTWLPNHATAPQVMEKLLGFEANPSVRRLLTVIGVALRG